MVVFELMAQRVPFESVDASLVPRLVQEGKRPRLPATVVRGATRRRARTHTCPRPWCAARRARHARTQARTAEYDRW
jgi:hypothetical protein